MAGDEHLCSQYHPGVSFSTGNVGFHKFGDGRTYGNANDAGLKHIAVALGIVDLALFCPRLRWRRSGILVTSRQSNSIYATLDFGLDIAGITCYAPAFYAQLKAAEKEAYLIVGGEGG